jgi:hypothetical protein
MALATVLPQHGHDLMGEVDGLDGHRDSGAGQRDQDVPNGTATF